MCPLCVVVLGVRSCFLVYKTSCLERESLMCCFNCYMAVCVLWLFLAALRVGLGNLILAFSGRSHLLFDKLPYKKICGYCRCVGFLDDLVSGKVSQSTCCQLHQRYFSLVAISRCTWTNVPCCVLFVARMDIRQTKFNHKNILVDGPWDLDWAELHKLFY